MEEPKKGMVPFEVREYFENGHMSQGIFIDNELFDWGVDEEDFKEAMSLGPEYVRIIQQDIARHFIESLSEFMGRVVTPQEVNEAQATGWIAK